MIFFLQNYLMFNVDISAKKGLAGNVSWMWALWDDILPSDSRCDMWKTCRLVCLLWPSHPRLSWASPPDEVWVTCVLSVTRDFKQWSLVLFLGRNLPWCLAGGSGPLLGWCHNLTWLQRANFADWRKQTCPVSYLDLEKCFEFSGYFT